MDMKHLRDFEEKAINFINTINPNYEINEDGFLYFPDKKIAISLNEKYESSNIYKPKDYFTNITNKYRDNGIRLMNPPEVTLCLTSLIAKKCPCNSWLMTAMSLPTLLQNTINLICQI